MSCDRILVVGASGMLGHEAIRVLAPDFEVWGACRDSSGLPDLGIPASRIVTGLCVSETDAASRLLDTVNPTFVLNAVGIVKQRQDAKAAVPSITVNSLWPHALADASEERGARLVHASTDCVFSGSRGGYTEADTPDATDLYGRSKLLGEVSDRHNAVTLRTSIIGWQLSDPTGLVGWFAGHRDRPLHGFTRAVFSGLTTRALTDVIRDTVLPDPELSGLWHLSADPIDKYTLLTKIADLMGWKTDIMPVDEPIIDRSLDSTRFRERTGWIPRSWDDMLEELASEYSWYA